MPQGEGGGGGNGDPPYGKGRLSRPCSTKCPPNPEMRKDQSTPGAGKVLASVCVQITPTPGEGLFRLAYGRELLLGGLFQGSVGEHRPAEEGNPRVRKTSLF